MYILAQEAITWESTNDYKEKPLSSHRGTSSQMRLVVQSRYISVQEVIIYADEKGQESEPAAVCLPSYLPDKVNVLSSEAFN